MEGAILVSPAEAQAWVDAGARVLDTRGALDFALGHIPGAVPVSWRMEVEGGWTSGRLAAPAVVAARYAALGVDAQTPVLVVGAWDRGWGEEGRVAWTLSYLGHPEVHVLEGGMEAWEGAETMWFTAPAPGAWEARPREALRATREEILAASGGSARIVDVREPEEFAGAARYGEARGGHIPGAESLPWREMLQGVPASWGRETPIIVYCTGGVRSGLAWVWLVDHGYTAASYDGSWWEWSREVPRAAD